MQLWTAFALGLIGSLHCAGMCGPLALALPVTGRGNGAFLAGRFVYNLGRVATYALLGALAGLLGLAFARAGLQRGISLAAGVAILAVAAASTRFAINTPYARAIGWLKSCLAFVFRRRTLGSLALLGALNGLLPCGMVYAACAGAVTTGSLVSGTAYMLLFGLGTFPMMFGIALAGRSIQPMLRLRLQRLIPAIQVALGLLLVLRALPFAIPYVTPALAHSGAVCH
jgi:sulfite exporter TauE/SafE